MSQEISQLPPETAKQPTIYDTYNPANAANLSDEDKAGMQNLTAEQIKALAKQYPNTATNNNYLLLLDKNLPVEKQLWQLSSWENLANLHKYGQHQFVAYGFRSADNPAAVPTSVANANVSEGQAPATRTVDLSEADAANADGLKSTEKTITTLEELATGLNAGERGLKVSDDPSLHGTIALPDEKVAGTTVLQEAPRQEALLPTVDNSAALAEAEAKLTQLKEAKAHPSTIKSQERRIADLKGSTDTRP